MPIIDARSGDVTESRYKFDDSEDYLFVQHGRLFIHSDFCDDNIRLCDMSDIGYFIKACKIAEDDGVPVHNSGIQRSTRSA